MEPEKVIIVFFKWLRENPSLFMPTAWQDLPKLDTEIAESADDELFPIAMTISKWCANHELGETLREDVAKNKKDFDDAGEPTPTTQQMLTNTTQTLRQAIEEACEKLRQLDAQKLDKGNDSK